MSPGVKGGREDARDKAAMPQYFRLLQRQPDRAVSCLTPAGLPDPQTKECIFCDFLDTFIDQGGDYRRNTYEYALANTASGKV